MAGYEVRTRKVKIRSQTYDKHSETTGKKETLLGNGKKVGKTRSMICPTIVADLRFCHAEDQM